MGQYKSIYKMICNYNPRNLQLRLIYYYYNQWVVEVFILYRRQPNIFEDNNTNAL